jgi:hypothetical protein
MITDHDRSGWIGASDVQYVLGNWSTKTWEKWWMTKLGLSRKHVDTESTLAGTNWEHKILDSLGLPDLEKDKQILLPDLRLRVNLDGNTPGRIYECKTYKIGGASNDIKMLTQSNCPPKYWRQVQVQMFATKIYGADLVAYGLVAEDYQNYLRSVDPGRRKLIPISYDPHWVEQIYLPKHIVLCDALKRGVFPYV